MALTESNMIPLGTIAPSFSLLDTISNHMLSFSDIQGEKATVVMFLCNHCPFVIHINSELVNIANNYIQRGVGLKTLLIGA